MKQGNFLSKLAAIVLKPFQEHGAFIFWMYLLGCVCAWTTLPSYKGAKLYSHLYTELFFDCYLAAAILTLLPHRVGVWTRRLLYVVLYAVALVDVYCFQKFGSTLNPTMLLLLGETNAREASEAVGTFLNANIIFGKTGWILLLIVLHALTTFLYKKFIARHIIFNRQTIPTARIVLAILVAGLFIWCASDSWRQKIGMTELMTAKTIGQAEHMLTDRYHNDLYTPINRLLFSIRANKLTAKQIDQLQASAAMASAQQTTEDAPKNIVLIIGESYGKQHSSLYGYPIATAPKQQMREKGGLLTKFTDVVAPWNLTSFVFKLTFSCFDIGDKGEWCDKPLFPQLFRKAGFHVTFLTNQFLPRAKQAVYDFSGGFFLNHPTLSKELFDTRNEKLHRLDSGILEDYDKKKSENGERNLIILHLMGQHVSYSQRYPSTRRHFTSDDYKTLRADLTEKQRQMLAHYDNACRYNDSIVDAICQRFANDDAVVVYMPDHGEECYEGNRGFICRQHNSDIDYDWARFECEIPFWIWCSKTCAAKHKELFSRIKAAKDKPFMTDALPHLLMGIAGITSPSYKASDDLLSPAYNAKRKRLLKNSVDYDRLRQKAQQQ